ncbi:MAG: hypothetical protein ACT4TC_09220 [Myxococcaceae bacterium]
MNPSEPPPTVLRGLLGTAFLLSAVYLVLGLVVELLFARWQVPLMEAVSRAVDALPAGILRPTGLLEKMTELYQDDRLPKYGLRIIFGATTVAFFYAVALFVAGLTAVARRFLPTPKV